MNHWPLSLLLCVGSFTVYLREMVNLISNANNNNDNNCNDSNLDYGGVRISSIWLKTKKLDPRILERIMGFCKVRQIAWQNVRIRLHSRQLAEQETCSEHYGTHLEICFAGVRYSYTRASCV